MLDALITSLRALEPAHLDGVALLTEFHATHPGVLTPPPDYKIEQVQAAAAQLLAYQIECDQLRQSLHNLSPRPMHLHQIDFGL
jgi:hypothetical protein